MRQLFSCVVVAASMLSAACATAIEEGGYGAELDGESGNSPGGSRNVSGGANSGGTGVFGVSGSANAMAGGSKGGTPSTGAFGGSATSGGKGGGGSGGASGSSSGGSPSGGASTGGKGGTANGGTAGTGTSGSASGGSGSAGAPSSTVCDGVPDWTSKAYALHDSVASSCAAPFNGTCAIGQSHKFECNPQAGAVALAWCQQREPGKGNGWAEAWVDKGQCQ